MIVFIDVNGTSHFCKTMEELKLAIKNGWVREAYLNNKKIF